MAPRMGERSSALSMAGWLDMVIPPFREWVKEAAADDFTGREHFEQEGWASTVERARVGLFLSWDMVTAIERTVRSAVGDIPDLLDRASDLLAVCDNVVSMCKKAHNGPHIPDTIAKWVMLSRVWAEDALKRYEALYEELARSPREARVLGDEPALATVKVVRQEDVPRDSMGDQLRGMLDAFGVSDQLPRVRRLFSAVLDRAERPGRVLHVVFSQNGAVEWAGWNDGDARVQERMARAKYKAEVPVWLSRFEELPREPARDEDSVA